jgi:hypothetical protein
VDVQLSVPTKYGGELGGRDIRCCLLVAECCELALLMLVSRLRSCELDCPAVSKANGFVTVSNNASHRFLDASVRASSR